MRALVFISFLFFGLESIANETLWVVTEDRPPYNYLNQKDEIKGSNVPFVKRVLNEAQLPYEMSLFPWARSYQLALTRPNTVIFSILKTPERADLFHWFCPISPTKPILFMQLSQRSSLGFETIEQAKHFVIGVSRGDWNEQFLLAQGFKDGVNLDVSADEGANLSKLLAGRVDALLVTEQSLIMRLASLNLTPKTVKRVSNREYQQSIPLCMALSKKSSAEVVTAISEAFSVVRKAR